MVIIKNPIGERVFVFIWNNHMKNFLGKMSIYTATMLASFSEIINFIKFIRNLLYNFKYFLEIDIYYYSKFKYFKKLLMKIIMNFIIIINIYMKFKIYIKNS